MIYDIDINEMNLDINKGEVVIERQHKSNASLSFDDKFKSYITVLKENGLMKIKVSDDFKDSVKFHLNLAKTPKCFIHLQSGIIRANALCKYSKYSVDTGVMNVNVPNSLLGIAEIQVSLGALDVNNGKYTVSGTSNHYQYKGTLIEQKSHFIVTAGSMKCNFV